MAGQSVKALALSHFRSHRAARLEFDGRPVALIGANGAGKTNILEAISLLSPGRGLRRAAAEDIARRPEKIGWKVTAQISALDDHEVTTWAEGGGSRQVRIDGKAASQMALGRILRVLWLVPAMDRLWIEAAEGRRRFLDRLTLSFFPDHAENSLGYEKAMRERNRLLKDGVKDAFWYQALEQRMSQAAQRITANRIATIDRLVSAQAGGNSAFPKAGLSLINPEYSDDLIGAWAATRGRDMAAGRTLIGPHRADLGAIYMARDVAADQCSTGEQKALLLSLILANARAVTADLGQAPVLLLDEIAAHLDPGRRAALYDEIVQLGVQAVMTGTEASLFDNLGARAQIFSLSDADGQSFIAQEQK